MTSRKRYHTVVSAGLFVLASFFIFFRLINRSIENRMAVQLQKIKTELAREKQIPAPAQKKKKQQRVLRPSDLTSYQIIPHRKSRLFKNQQYWDIMTRNALRRSEIAGRGREGGIFKGIVKSPGQFKKRIREIDRRIRAYKQKIRRNPGDDDAKQKLQNLYMVKATLKALKETIVSGSD